MKVQNVATAMQARPKPPTPEEMIAKADEDNNGALSISEWQTITDKISLHHKIDLDAEKLLEQYDEDGDGSLSKSEAQSALTGIADQLGVKPPPPPPPPEEEETESWENKLLLQAILTYQENAKLGEE